MNNPPQSTMWLRVVFGMYLIPKYYYKMTFRDIIHSDYAISLINY